MALPCAVKGCGAGILLAALAGSSEAPAQPTPVGPEFQVNTYTTGTQRIGSVAMDADGDFVVVWQSDGSTSGTRIQGQRYDSAGSAVGSEFQISPTIVDNASDVAAAASGEFVVVWWSEASSGSDTSRSIQGKRYDSTGNALGSRFQINTYTTGQQLVPSIAVGPDGNFVVVWESDGSSGGDTSSRSIQGQRYGSAGNALGSEFQVNTYTTGEQGSASIAVDGDGDVVVVWDSDGSSGGDTSTSSIQGQRYDSAGNAVGGEFQVNTYTTNGQTQPSVSAEADGDFVVVWRSDGSYGDDTSLSSIQGQRYESTGSAVGSQFQANTYTTSSQTRPAVAAHADGGFVVAWQSSQSSGTDDFVSVQGQHFASSGSPIGGQFQINTYTTNYQQRPSVAAGAGGGFVVAWTSYGSAGSDTSEYSIQGQRYATPVKVPSLSPAGLAAAALLVCLAALVALRRRV